MYISVRGIDFTSFYDFLFEFWNCPDSVAGIFCFLFYYMLTTCTGQIKNQKVLFKVGTFVTAQHKLSRAFQTDMHNKIT